MKRIIKIGLLALVLSLGLSKKSEAVQQVCGSVVTVCSNGCTYNYTICGDSYEDYIAKVERAAEALCGN
jgi:hypothetical protein